MCEDQLWYYLKKSAKKIEDLILIIDEADQVLFTEQTTKVKGNEIIQWRDKLLTYAKASIIYAFTGTLSKIEA